MDRVAGKVAFITGGARGQGRAHAIRMAEEGADVIIVDILEKVATSPVPMANDEDMVETVHSVEGLGRRIIAEKVDVRDQAGLDAVVARGIEELGGIDIVVANAGMTGFGRAWELSEAEWQEMIDVNLTGVWHAVKAVVPTMIEAGKGGSIVLTSSTAGVQGVQNMAHYTAAKHGVVGLMKTLANELGPENIRVNSILPGPIATPMVMNEVVYKLFAPDNPSAEAAADVFRALAALPVVWLEPIDIANAALWLSSDEARYVTGIQLSVDAGWVNK